MTTLRPEPTLRDLGGKNDGDSLQDPTWCSPLVSPVDCLPTSHSGPRVPGLQPRFPSRTFLRIHLPTGGRRHSQSEDPRIHSHKVV